MRTSLAETRQIEQYLLQLAPPNEMLLFDAKLLLDESLQEKLQMQKKTHEIVKQYGRKQLRKEIDAIHQMLFTSAEHRSFRQKIMQIFSR
ncbi:MAG TPA: hypothetical protein VHA56_01735 [Mucilaginibacter sp.]|nr:hypothetical protein [Mucilaginibacter sp.]